MLKIQELSYLLRNASVLGMRSEACNPQLATCNSNREPLPVVVRTRLTPPRPNQRIMPRPRLASALAEALDYRVTLLQAGAGYGKSTALATVAELGHPLAWYQLDSDSADPLVVLAAPAP